MFSMSPRSLPCRRSGVVLRPAAMSATRQRHRFDLQRGADRLARVRRALGRRVPSHHELVQEHAEGIHIGGGGDRPALQLLRRGVLGRQGALAFGGDRGALDPVLEQLGDAEVQQLHDAIGADQDVARLDVAMHHQVAVRMRHRGEHVVEQREAPVDVQPMQVAIAVDGFARDEVEHEVGLSARRHARVEQARDVRVGQPGQDGAFALEARCAGVAEHRQVQQLDRHAAADAPVGAMGAPHAAAAALAQQRLDDVAADLRAFERRRGR